MPSVESVKLTTPSGVVSGEWLTPDNPRAIFVCAHGAGAGFKHANMEAIANACAGIQLDVLRFNFPYMEASNNDGKMRRVDRQEVSVATIVAAVKYAAQKQHPIFLGGHSYGGRMSSHAALEEDMPSLSGLVYCSFPLHPPKKPSLKRAEHLKQINLPMLFVSGSRDTMAQKEWLEDMMHTLHVDSRLRWLQTANHGYQILKRTRTLQEDVFTELAGYVDDFVSHIDIST